MKKFSSGTSTTLSKTIKYIIGFGLILFVFLILAFSYQIANVFKVSRKDNNSVSSSRLAPSRTISIDRSKYEGVHLSDGSMAGPYGHIIAYIAKRLVQGRTTFYLATRVPRVI